MNRVCRSVRGKRPHILGLRCTPAEAMRCGSRAWAPPPHELLRPNRYARIVTPETLTPDTVTPESRTPESLRLARVTEVQRGPCPPSRCPLLRQLRATVWRRPRSGAARLGVCGRSAGPERLLRWARTAASLGPSRCFAGHGTMEHHGGESIQRSATGSHAGFSA